MVRRPQHDFENSSFLARLIAPFRSVFGGDDGDGSPIAAEDSPWRLSSMISFPVRLISALAVFFVSAWSSSRHWWPFVLGIPAMLVVVAALGAATIPPWLLRLDKKRDVLYQGRFETYLTTPEHAKYAMACALRSSDRNPGELMFKYLVGAAYQAGGDIAATQRTMSSLAPLDKPGFPRAHLWLADTELSKIGRAGDDDQESYKVAARQHLDLALAKEGDDVFSVDMAVANMRLAQMYFAERRFEEAIPILQRLVTNRLEYTIQLTAFPMLIEAVASQGNPQRTDVALQRMLDILLPLARQSVDSVELWRAIVLCCLRAERFERAQDFMEEALVLSRDPRVKFRLALLKSELYLFRALQFEDFETDADYRGRLDAAARALLSNPVNRQAYGLLLPYVDAFLLDQDRERMLREAMLTADTRPIIQIMVGFGEALRGQSAEAERMWRIASQSFPNAPFVVANLMFVSVETSSFAIEKIEQGTAIAEGIFPDNITFRIVRAELEIARGQFEAARALVVPLLETNADILQLQVTYLRILEHDGDEEAIARQQDAINELRQKIMQQL